MTASFIFLEHKSSLIVGKYFSKQSLETKQNQLYVLVYKVFKNLNFICKIETS